MKILQILFILSTLALRAFAGHETQYEVIHTHSGDIPRFATHSENVLIVPIGETVTLPAESDHHAIEIAGTLKVSRDYDTRCRFVHLTILPGGKLDAGTAADPVLKTVEFVFADVPLDPDRDPMQWGNGVINLGTFWTHGRKLLHTWATMGEVDGGASVLTGFAGFAGLEWAVGDALLLPDTRQLRTLGNSPLPIRKEPVAMIAGMSAESIDLAEPLAFEHHGAYSPDGQRRYLPYVANASRNIVFRSENPSGTRGHIVHLGEAKVDANYTAFVGLGRTTTENLDNSTVDEDGKLIHFGTNQIARYAFHWHHVRHVGSPDNPGPHFGTINGCYLDGSGIGKWGIVVHATHDCYVGHNVLNGFVGSGIVTEDGDEIRSTFEHNFVMGSVGNGINGKFNFVPPNNKPGAEGAGFWFHGMGLHTIRENVSINNAVGFQFLYRNQVLGRAVPHMPGGEYTLALDPRKTIPLELRNNVGAANSDNGWETWNNPKMETTDTVHVWHNGKAQMTTGNGEPSSFYAKNFFALAKYLDDDRDPVGISSSAAYTPSIELHGGRIEGCRIGASDARAVLLKNVELQNETNISYVIRPNKTVLDNVTHKQLFNEPKRYIVFSESPEWLPGQPFPTRYSDWFTDNTGQRYVIKNWQGTGQDYLLFEPHSLRQRAGWPNLNNGVVNGVSARFLPEAGLTMGQGWDKYGIAQGGGVIDQSEVASLDGLHSCLARAGLNYPLGPTRAVLTVPNMLAPANIAANGQITHIVTISGVGQSEPNYLFFQIDQNTPIRTNANQFTNGRFIRTAVGTEPGTHTVKTWLQDASGERASEEMAFRYFVGEPSEVEPEPEPEPEPDPTPDPEPDPTPDSDFAAQIAALSARVAALEAKLAALKAALE